MAPRGPWTVDVADLRADPSSSRNIELSGTIRQMTVGSTPTRADRPVRLVPLVEPVDAGVSVRGVLTIEWAGSCRRCLDPVEGVVSGEVDEVFLEDDVDGDSYELVDDAIDLSPMVHDLAAVSLPIVPLCDERCEGPVPDRFPVHVDDPNAPRPPDPRWAALDVLRDPDGAEG